MNRFPLFKSILLALLLAGAGSAHADDIRLSLPPDPNALPVFVLMEKQEAFLPGDRLQLVANPSGDPSAMRAMVQARRMDFALFNLVGGTRFIQGGLEGLHLVGPWVWRGIYLLTPESSAGLEALDGKAVLVSPGVSTPPHIVTQKALQRVQVEAKFVTGGSGAVLLNQLSTPERAPAAMAAAEPQVSLILHRQQAEEWAQRWKVALDPADALGGAVPLGALWQVHEAVDPALRERLVEGLKRAAAWAQDPRNHAEAARIGARGYQAMFRLPIPEAALRDMLDAQRVDWRLEQDAAMRQTVTRYLADVFGLQAPASLFLPE